MPYLKVDADARELVAGDLIIGSAAQAAWRVANKDLAARHLVVTTAANGIVTVRPFTSGTLVTVNGRVIQGPTSISLGDYIGAGSANFAVVDRADAPAELPPQRAYLIDEGSAIAYALQRKTLHVGRDAGSTIQVKDPEVSRYHADVRTEAGLHVLYTLGTTGTKVNGQPAGETRILEEGDRIEIGELRLRYTRGAPAPGMRVSSGGEDYDLGISQLPTGRAPRFEPNPVKQVSHPRFLPIIIGAVILLAILLVALMVM